MSKYVYLKQPGILYDMMFALKLRFNGERAYIVLNKDIPLSTDTEQLYKQVIDKLSDVSDKLLPLFYWNESPKKKTGLLAYMRQHMYLLDYTKDGLIDEFYDSLRDVQRLKKFIYKNYISEDCPDVIDLGTFGQIKESLYNAELPADVKMYMMDFFIYGENEVDFIIDELKKAQTICEELYQLNYDKVTEQIERFDDNKIEALSKLQMWDIMKFSPIYHTYCVLNKYSIYGETYSDDYIAYLGIESDDLIYEHISISVDLYELGRILYDETRLKILSMLREKPMYCAEIAKALGLKNNSTLYHLTMMTKQNLLYCYSNGKKIFYRIYPHYLDSLKEYINMIKMEIQK